MNNSFKSGFVTILGRPNVGKSTLMNKIIKEKIAIVTPKAQTTRNRIQGIYTTDQCQIIFIDTPGVHKARNTLGERMNNYALSSLDGIDVVLLVVDATVEFGPLDEVIINSLKTVKVPVILVLNKIDLIQNMEKLETIINKYRSLYDFKGGITISAKEDYAINELLEKINSFLPIGPLYYPEDQLMDGSLRFLTGEIIREKVLLATEDEVPHSVGIEIEEFLEKPNMTEIKATIIVERNSQKKIIIGHGGVKIKEIGTNARKEIVKLLDTKVYLELFVKVRDDWRNDDVILKELGYQSNK